MSAAFSILDGALAGQIEPSDSYISTGRLFYAARFIGALLVATLVPLLIDRHARRSSS